MAYEIVPTKISALFPRSYDGSRARFRNNLDKIQQAWPNARLASHRLSGDEELTVDWIAADALEKTEKIVVLTTGEHGMEAFVGAGMLQVFVDEFLGQLLPENTGLLLVHAINPWGMKHWRRVNRNNVDLNRNFVWLPEGEMDEPGAFLSLVNPHYEQLSGFLNPQRPLRGWLRQSASFWIGLLGALLSAGAKKIQRATLLGQHRFPQGIYYGGNAFQEETRLLMGLFNDTLEPYRQILLMDMHTGYGPRYQMSLVNSALDLRDSTEFARQIDYPLVIKSTPDEFYSIQGDMIDYVYHLVQEVYPDKGLFATTFEFGTLGDSTLALLRSLRAMIFENQMSQFGVNRPAVRSVVEREFRELFFPEDEQWRAKAVADARRAFRGILRAEGFLTT